MTLCNERSIITKFSDCNMLSWLYQSCTFTSCACDCQSWPAVESNVALDKRLAAIKDGSEGFLQVSSFLFWDIITNSASSTFWLTPSSYFQSAGSPTRTWSPCRGVFESHIALLVANMGHCRSKITRHIQRLTPSHCTAQSFQERK